MEEEAEQGHVREQRRLEILRSYDVIDTPPEPVFERLIELVTRLLDVPIAAISLIDRDRQWFKAQRGLPVPETSRDIAFCAHAIHGEDLFLVSDTHADPRFVDNPLVTGEPGLRFYAGAPLRDRDGVALGTLCIMDRTPRELVENDRETLRVLAQQVMAQLDLRRQYRLLAASSRESRS
ncbi:MAG: GAF domain-containing protein, partial [Xanthomonadaceae bacterium]|nr:GAF domain-containing protein [Xanthomonadaceae bacterium]